MKKHTILVTALVIGLVFMWGVANEYVHVIVDVYFLNQTNAAKFEAAMLMFGGSIIGMAALLFYYIIKYDR